MKSSVIHMSIWVSICAVAIVGQGFWYAVIVNKSAKVAELQNQIDTKTETADRVAAARTALTEIAGDESAIRNYFVPETEVVSFIDNLEGRARTQKTTMKVLSVSVNNSSKQTSLVLSLVVGGTFDAVMRTVGAIEFAPYDLSISKLSIVNEEKNVWNAHFEIVVGSIPASTEPSTKAVEQKTVSFIFP